MRITHALLGEHGAIYPLLDLIERSAPTASLDDLHVHARFLHSTLISHAGLEDAILRPAIEQHLPPRSVRPDGSLEPTDHQVIDAGLSMVLECTDADLARDRLLDTVHKTRTHFAKEEHLIFGLADRELPRDVQERLGLEWAARRSVFLSV